jgi:excisionase family DNA binding protein
VAAREHDGRRLDVLAAACYLGVTVRHLRQLVFERRLAHFKLGRRLAFDTVDLDAFLAANRRDAVE